MEDHTLEDIEKKRDPERILKQIKAAEEGQEALAAGHRGRLKIFFGYAAGVGKTYAMLDAARTDLRAGRDVVAGYIEPHARPETMALTEEIEMLPIMDVEHRGIHIREFDLDGALARHPELILVDEMAHTNAEVCRHRKRWQDIQELLDAGIDVYTTVNVQHLESLHDIVASITHIRVSERVPDRVFDEADKIELVDTPPEELLTRMKAGKIYQGERAARAMGNFFTLENLTALREIALRRTADQVNRAVIRQRQAGQREYYTGEHVLLCISPAPSNEKVVRTAARMASAFNAKITAVAVVRPGTGKEQEKFLRSVETNLALAHQFGAETVTLYGEDVAEQITEYARQNGVSKIVIGRTVRPRGVKGAVAGALGHKNLIDRLIAMAPNMDVYVIPDVKASVQKKNNFAARLRAKEVDRAQFAIELVACAILLAMATFVGFQIDKLNLGESNLVMSYMLAVILTAGFSRYWMTGVASSLGAVFLYNFFFTEPRFTMQATAYYPFTFLAMLVCALTVSSLAARLKNQARMSREESKKLQVLIAFSNKVNLAAEPGEVLRVCAEQVMHLLNRSVVIYGTDAGKANLREVFLREGAGEEEQNVFLLDREQAVAYWVMKNCHRAGRTTDTLPEASGCYFPVKRDGVVYGVVGIRMEDNDVLRADDRNLLYVLLDETAVALKACKIHGGR